MLRPFSGKKQAGRVRIKLHAARGARTRFERGMCLQDIGMVPVK
jgi:hypothetical protein